MTKEKSAKQSADRGPTEPQVGLDNRGEATRRYGDLEEAGYSRHSHGDREGEFQRGGKKDTGLPVESSSPMKDQRYRNEPAQEEGREPQYGGRTFDADAGDKDVVPKKQQ